METRWKTNALRGMETESSVIKESGSQGASNLIDEAPLGRLAQNPSHRQAEMQPLDPTRQLKVLEVWIPHSQPLSSVGERLATNVLGSLTPPCWWLGG